VVDSLQRPRNEQLPSHAVLLSVSGRLMNVFRCSHLLCVAGPLYRCSCFLGLLPPDLAAEWSIADTRLHTASPWRLCQPGTLQLWFHMGIIGSANSCGSLQYQLVVVLQHVPCTCRTKARNARRCSPHMLRGSPLAGTLMAYCSLKWSTLFETHVTAYLHLDRVVTSGGPAQA